MENEHISEFEDQPVIQDRVHEYTEALHAVSVPIVIDNGNKDMFVWLDWLLYHCVNVFVIVIDNGDTGLQICLSD